MSKKPFKQQVSERLAQLASSEENRPKSARFRDVYSQVEDALAAGVSRASVLLVLKEGGLDLTLSTLDSYLRRCRNQAKEKGVKKTRAILPQQASEPTREPSINKGSEEEGDSESPGSHDPAALNKIIGSTVNLDQLAKHGRVK
ncbi:hypothetical protein [Pseudomonas sp. JG-B]|uniref:hypothetical protein n=1 Tax=Pseudomonas sp. JG-B TaxID=2603214 RepID=UPI00129E35DE|nr:hypothetical protein [Pseudomonas sp. JG-B]MRK19068.1 hypothetical protein [Pseudomonas sp. JG-B]